MEKQSILLFVGGLPLHACDQNLSRYFRKFGSLDSAEVKRTPDGKSKGYGFVKFIKAEDALAALQPNIHQILGRQVTVEPAQDPKEREYLGKSRSIRKVVIWGIPSKLHGPEILASLARIGSVETITPISQSVGSGEFFCTVIMQDHEKSQALIQKSVLELRDGTILRVSGVSEANLSGFRTPQETSQKIRATNRSVHNSARGGLEAQSPTGRMGLSSRDQLKRSATE